METAQILAAETPAAPTRDRILDAAEAEFSQKGFGGAGMKGIATAAGVAQGLLHYHFDNKDKLYEAVVARRSSAINAARELLLSKINLSAPEATRDIFDAFFRPPLGEPGGSGDYARIFANLASGTSRDGALVQKYYDPTAQKFIAALMAAQPDADLKTASWAYTLAVGSLVSVVSRDGRRERLSGEHGRQGLSAATTENAIRHLTLNATGGLNALISDKRKPD